MSRLPPNTTPPHTVLPASRLVAGTATFPDADCAQLSASELPCPRPFAPCSPPVATSTSGPAAAAANLADLAGLATHASTPSSNTRPPCPSVPGPLPDPLSTDPAIYFPTAAPRTRHFQHFDQAASGLASALDVASPTPDGVTAEKLPCYPTCPSPPPAWSCHAQQHLTAVQQGTAPAPAGTAPTSMRQDPRPLVDLSGLHGEETEPPLSPGVGVLPSVLFSTSMKHSLSAPCASPELPSKAPSEHPSKRQPAHTLPPTDVSRHKGCVPSLSSGAEQLDPKDSFDAQLSKTGLSPDGHNYYAAATRYASSAPGGPVSNYYGHCDNPPSFGFVPTTTNSLPELGLSVSPMGSAGPADPSLTSHGWPVLMPLTQSHPAGNRSMSSNNGNYHGSCSHLPDLASSTAAPSASLLAQPAGLPAEPALDWCVFCARCPLPSSGHRYFQADGMLTAHSMSPPTTDLLVSCQMMCPSSV